MLARVRCRRLLAPHLTFSARLPRRDSISRNFAGGGDPPREALEPSLQQSTVDAFPSVSLPVPPTLNATPTSVLSDSVPRGRVSTIIGSRELSLEVGRVGPLADAVVYARYGGTTVLASAVSSWSPAVGGGFLPLQVDYVEKAFAAGQIPSTFTRRESSSSDRELLAARAIDRSLRPLFDDGYFYDTQIICSVMSFDPDCDPGMLAIVASSAALHVSVEL